MLNNISHLVFIQEFRWMMICFRFSKFIFYSKLCVFGNLETINFHSLWIESNIIELRWKWNRELLGIPMCPFWWNFSSFSLALFHSALHHTSSRTNNSCYQHCPLPHPSVSDWSLRFPNQWICNQMTWIYGFDYSPPSYLCDLNKIYQVE